MDNKNQTPNATPPPTPSPAVVKRLPRYYRYLRELITQGKMRISSGELSAMMNVTASQIRQDLNCFGGFGQQGYGYPVDGLLESIGQILKLDQIKTAVIVGTGNLGRAIINNFNFFSNGFFTAKESCNRNFSFPRNLYSLFRLFMVYLKKCWEVAYETDAIIPVPVADYGRIFIVRTYCCAFFGKHPFSLYAETDKEQNRIHCKFDQCFQECIPAFVYTQ